MVKAYVATPTPIAARERMSRTSSLVRLTAMVSALARVEDSEVALFSPCVVVPLSDESTPDTLLCLLLAQEAASSSSVEGWVVRVAMVFRSIDQQQASNFKNGQRKLEGRGGLSTRGPDAISFSFMHGIKEFD
jgi:hypothetical protein